MRLPNWLKTLVYLVFFVGALTSLLRPVTSNFALNLIEFIFKFLVLPVAVLTLPIILFVTYRIIKTRREFTVYKKKRVQRIKPLELALETLKPSDVYPFAKDVTTRWDTYELLRAHGMTELFPEEFHTIEKAAEGKMVSWLESPNKLAAVPDMIEPVENVVIEAEKEGFVDAQVSYCVFRFRIYEPHWAAGNGWMLGVVGPYSLTAEPYDWPAVTFSRLNIDRDWEEAGELPEVTAQEEDLWVHKKIAVTHYQDREATSV